jgi:hypothetical protein
MAKKKAAVVVTEAVEATVELDLDTPEPDEPEAKPTGGIYPNDVSKAEAEAAFERYGAAAVKAFRGRGMTLAQIGEAILGSQR